MAKFAVYKGSYTFDDLPQALAQLDATNSPFKDLIPSHGWERFHFNLWLMHGKPPQGRQEVIVTGFEYLPRQKREKALSALKIVLLPKGSSRRLYVRLSVRRAD